MKLIRLFTLIFLLLSTTLLFAQQKITQFGVIDTTRVYTTYFRDSAAVRSYEKKKTDFQNEINRQTDELKKLQARKIEYQQNGDSTAEIKLDAEIQKKANFLTEYTKAKNIELDNIKKKLESSDEFYSILYDTIARIAEAEGYSMILSLNQANGILWYSQTVDITDKVINNISDR